MRSLGPLDRRSIRKRCVACARRKIKCEGTPPCVYCVKMKQECIPQAVPMKTEAIFVNASGSGKGKEASHIVIHHPRLQTNPNVPQHTFVRHFFSEFLARNELARALDVDTITSGFQESTSLHNAVLALGAFDLSKKNHNRGIMLAGLTAYRASVISFQEDIESEGVLILKRKSSLWTTFFLGIFELMYDVTGEGWVKHVLYGTSKILQLRGPDAHSSGPGRSFFLTIRIFEICRSLIYTEPSFLCDPGWMNLMTRIWDGEMGSNWHPKEDLYDLMILCSSLGWRTSEMFDPGSSYSADDAKDCRSQFATDGMDLRSRLGEWHNSFQKYSTAHEHDCQSIVAIIYFHAISIYLSGIFDYHIQIFHHIEVPTLPQVIIQAHVDAILLGVEAALKSTNLAPVLFFFPLRVAGARVTTVTKTARLSVMLANISNRGFVVADAFRSDLQGLWHSKKIYSDQHSSPCY